MWNVPLILISPWEASERTSGEAAAPVWAEDKLYLPDTKQLRECVSLCDTVEHVSVKITTFLDTLRVHVVDLYIKVSPW